MKRLNKLQSVAFELEEIESIEDIGCRNCTDISVEDDESFSLSNGIVSHNSARGGVSAALGRNGFGYYASRGVGINAYDATSAQILKNQEFSDIITILGLDITNPKEQNLNFKRFVITSDQDCMDEHTKVITDKGDKELKDIQYGDKVLTHSGEYHQVTNIIEKTTDKVVAIEFNGSVTYVSENHRLLVLRDGEVQEVRAGELKDTDLFLRKKMV